MSDKEYGGMMRSDRDLWKARAEAAERKLADAEAVLKGLRDSLLAHPLVAAQRKPTECPAGHGPMRYDIEDDHLHCTAGRCGAVATTHGNIIVDPSPMET